MSQEDDSGIQKQNRGQKHKGSRFPVRITSEGFQVEKVEWGVIIHFYYPSTSIFVPGGTPLSKRISSLGPAPLEVAACKSTAYLVEAERP